ncbi:MAG: aspartate--tRNA ligase [Erysipelothrix sp.]|nr:aspartate--tRNA ligase [Erysipelothrix sp.]
MRTHNNGELRITDVNQEVRLVGWVAKKRNLGSMAFVDLRDRYGKTQLVFDESFHEQLKDVRNEYVINVTGNVVERQSKNSEMETGDIEIVVTNVKVLSKAKTTPLIIDNETDALEGVRMKYRYLDLRRPNMQANLMLRSKISSTIRHYLEMADFIDIETPVLGKSTPEGARDYLVPSRNYPGDFYALPQSPQIYKQLLMISGFERYYQIAKCFRDEDLRADRQMEFTQVDIEASFLSDVEIQSLTETMMQKVFKDVLNVDIEAPFKRMTWADAMHAYGTDKPDLRFGMAFQDVKSIFADSEFKVLQAGLGDDNVIKAIVVPNYADLTRKNLDKLVDIVKSHGGHGILDLKYKDGQLDGRILKFFSESEISALTDQLNLSENDLVLIVSGEFEVSCTALGAVRSYLANELSMIDEDKFEFLWVTEFPLLEFDKEDDRYYARHHPFTRPMDEDLELLESNPKAVRAIAYDMILNGFELGGGSLRIYDNEMQTKMFEVLGFTHEEIRSQFGFFIDAFEYGTPPHGGIAFGLDRLAMLMAHETSIREVIAFPKNAQAKDPMMEAPSQAAQAQLDELSLLINQKSENNA